jgi:phosphoglucomutase
MNHENAGKLPREKDLISVASLLSAYQDLKPDVNNPTQQVAFGTSGHRGSSLICSFNENHILAMTQAICVYRKQQQIDGPVFVGFDTHALSFVAFQSALEVLAANDLEVMIAKDNDFTPTPVVSHAIIGYNLRRTSHFSDGIIITPSHNPPADGGFKYNPPHGGPAEKEITDFIQRLANDYLKANLQGVKRMPFERAMKNSTTHEYDFVTPYVSDLKNILDFDTIRSSKLKLAVDPMGGAGVHYWQKIAEHYQFDLKIVNTSVDPTFKFMTCDWDGKIRMDPSSPFVMQSLIQKMGNHDLAFGCDTDHDRHGIVTKKGLVPPNHYLAVMIHYLYSNRSLWNRELKIGKTIVSSSIINRVARELSREVFEVPVGFKWFVEGLRNETLGFAGEESAGATFARRDGKLWTTDKDGIIAALLSAEITAKTGKDPSDYYHELSQRLGQSSYQRVDERASTEKRDKIKKITGDDISSSELAGETILARFSRAPGNHAEIGGLKVESENAWFAVRPSGTEDIYKIYAESFKGEAHLGEVLKQAKKTVDDFTG